MKKARRFLTVGLPALMLLLVGFLFFSLILDDGAAGNGKLNSDISGSGVPDSSTSDSGIPASGVSGSGISDRDTSGGTFESGIAAPGTSHSQSPEDAGDQEEAQGQVQTIARWQWGDQELILPESIDCPAGRTPLTLTARVRPAQGDYLYLKTVYAPVRVYADGILIFQYGQTGSYPAFLLDPPTKVALVSVPAADREVTLTFEYLSPTQRNHVTLHPVLIGSPEAILRRLFSEMGLSVMFAGIFMVLGVVQWLMAFAVTRFEKTGIALLWLGMFSFCVGVWVLGECNLTGLFVEKAGLLYAMAFCGLFMVAIPMTKFCRVLFGTHYGTVLRGIELGLETAVCAALILQLTGTAALSRTMYLFHIVVPLAFLLCGFCVLQESRKYGNPLARRFFLPVVVLALFALVEVANYYVFQQNVQKSFFFQIGVLIALVLTSVLCGYFIRDAFMLVMRNRQLAFEVSVMEKQVEAQKDRYQFLSETSAALRRQRHDLKHHMAVIRRWAASGEREKLMEYLDQVSRDIPDGILGEFCENEAVNAVIFHYQAQAGKAGIPMVLELNIPADTGQVPDRDLCVIVGNLLENGIEACKSCREPFLTMKSRLFHGVLTITMDNAFSSVSRTPEGTFQSLKPGGGIGLLSIRSVAEKYGGGCRFEDRDGTFYSSVYLYLDPGEQGNGKEQAGRLARPAEPHI